MTETINYNNITLNVIHSLENIHIEDSYKIKKIKDMKNILNILRQNSNKTNSVIHSLTNFNMINEWRSHNLCYDLHILRSRTKDVDLNKNSFLIKIIYFIVSLFYPHF